MADTDANEGPSFDTFYETFCQMAPESQDAMAEIIEWVAYQKPKDVELSLELMDQWMHEIITRNRRRKLGVDTATVLPFPKPKE